MDREEVRDSDWTAHRERLVNILAKDANFAGWGVAHALLDELALSQKIRLSPAALRGWRCSGPPFFELPDHLIRYRPREVTYWLEERLGLGLKRNKINRTTKEERAVGNKFTSDLDAALREIDAATIGDEARVAKFLAVTPAILEEWRERKIGPEFVALPGMSIAYSRLAIETWLLTRIGGRRPKAAS